MFQGFLKTVIFPLFKSYLAKLATKEFFEWALLEIADAAVKSTKTGHDDKWLAKFKRTIGRAS